MHKLLGILHHSFIIALSKFIQGQSWHWQASESSLPAVPVFWARASPE
jgi:hypothetical protein